MDFMEKAKDKSNKKEATPFLSICIPTYNRCSKLDATLESIVSDESFSDSFDIEIIISDNCSTDETAEICQKYLNLFPDKIKYFKTETNIGGEANFHRALSLGSGQLLKLINDKCCFQQGAVSEMLAFVKQNSEKKPLLFFPNKLKATNEDNLECSSLNDFVDLVSFKTTWIGSFSIWKKDFDVFENFNRYAYLQLIQCDVLYRLISAGKSVKVLNKDLIETINTRDTGGYNPALVFGKNYLFILSEYVENGHLTKKTYNKEKRRILFPQIGKAYFDCGKRFSYKQDGLFCHLFPIYKFDLYFYFWLTACYLKLILYPLKGIYDFIWANSNIMFYKYINKNEKKVIKYQEKKRVRA